MSEHITTQLDEGTIAALRARDARIAAITDAIDVQTELRDSRALRLVMERLTVEATTAMEQFAFANPADTATIIGLQARVYCAVFLDRVLRRVQEQGRVAEQAMNEEEGRA